MDASSVRFEICAWASFAVLLISAGLPFIRGLRRSDVWRPSPWLFGIGVLLCAATFHWPSIRENQELGDPDESQLMAAAITLAHDPLYYRSVDGATCGPVDEMPLAALAAIGVKIDYEVAHAVALALSLVGVFATWLTLRHLFGDAIGGLAILPLATMIAFCDFNQFLHYSTEQCPAALIAIACCCLVYAWDRFGRIERPARLAGCGLALGAVPFAKLQAGPIALFVALAGFLLIAATSSAPWRSRRRAALLLAVGGMIIPAVLLFGIWFWGQWGEFTRSYIEVNLTYLSARSFPWHQAPAHLFNLIYLAPGLETYLLPCIAVVALMGVGMRPVLSSWPHRMALFSFSLLLVSTAVVMAPARNVFHYLHFIFFPAALCMGCFLGARAQTPKAKQIASDRPWVLYIFALLLIGFSVSPQIIWRIRAPNPYCRSYLMGGSPLAVSEPAREILRHSKIGDCLAIWGWTPRLWVETGLWQGTRDGNTSRQIESSSQQGMFQQRYLHDLIRNTPSVFVDSVGAGNFIADRANNGHEQYPEIGAYIAKEYKFVREVDAMRIYVRKDLR
jgi:hypothetical protein